MQGISSRNAENPRLYKRDPEERRAVCRNRSCSAAPSTPSSTTSTAAWSSSDLEDLSPTPSFSSSPHASSIAVAREPAALDTRSSVIVSVVVGVSILNPTHRIIRINLPQLDLRQDRTRQFIKNFLHALPTQRRNLHSRRNPILTRPIRRRRSTHSPPTRIHRSPLLTPQTDPHRTAPLQTPSNTAPIILHQTPTRRVMQPPLHLHLLRQSRRTRIHQITLIPRHHHRQLRTRQGARIIQKSLQFRKTPLITHIVHQHRARRASVITPRNAAKALRARGIPQLELDSFTSGALGADFDDFGGEFDAYGLRGEDAPFVFDEAVQEAGFAAVGGAEEDDFREVITSSITVNVGNIRAYVFCMGYVLLHRSHLLPTHGGDIAGGGGGARGGRAASLARHRWRITFGDRRVIVLGVGQHVECWRR